MLTIFLFATDPYMYTITMNIFLINWRDGASGSVMSASELTGRGFQSKLDEIFMACLGM